MSRYEDGPALFGEGMGSSTGYELICEFCGTVHNKGADAENDPHSEGGSVCYDTFAGKQVCDCCYEEIERAVMARMKDIILPWYLRAIKEKGKDMVERFDQFNLIKEFEELYARLESESR